MKILTDEVDANKKALLGNLADISFNEESILLNLILFGRHLILQRKFIHQFEIANQFEITGHCVSIQNTQKTQASE